MGKPEEDVLEILRKNDPMYPKDVASVLKLTEATMRRRLRKMHKQGLVIGYMDLTNARRTRYTLKLTEV
jgi:DNA-binding MarR family transcriptional regulator